MLMMILVSSIPVWNKSCSVLTLFAGLLVLPYTVAIGTGNALFTQVMDSLAPWGAVVAVLIVAKQSDDFNKMVTLLVGFCFMGIVSLQIITSGLQPYHLSSPLTKQEKTVVVEGLGKIKVDGETFKFITDLKAAAKVCDITPGTPFLGFYNIPGVALSLQAIPVMTPWLNNKSQAEFVLERVRSANLHSAVLALKMEVNGTFPLLPEQLVTFPFGYRYCGMAIYPLGQQKIQIWQPLAR
jgi:hypothetical protein